MATTKTYERRPVPDYLDAVTAATALNESISIPGLLYQPPTAHVLSPLNQHYVAIQNRVAKRDGQLTAPAGFWKGIGRYVKKNEKGMFVLTPMKFPRTRVDANGNPVLDARGKRITDWVPNGRYELRPTRFDISQTQGKDVEFPETPFDLGKLLCALEVEMVAFAMDDMGCGGYCYGDDAGDYVAINPLWPDPLGVLMHELGHIVLGHTRENLDWLTTGKDRTPRNRRELGAEGTALVILDSLGYKEQQHSRGYIQNWNIEGLKTIPDALAADIFSAGNIIFRAGLGLENRSIRLKKKTT